MTFAEKDPLPLNSDYPASVYPVWTQHPHIAFHCAWQYPAVEILELAWLPYYSAEHVQFLCQEAEAWCEGLHAPYVTHDHAIMVTNEQRRREQKIA